MRMNKYFKTDSKEKYSKITVLIYNFETFLTKSAKRLSGQVSTEGSKQMEKTVTRS